MISIIADTPEELQKVFEIMRSNDTQIHVDTVAQTAKGMATEPKFEVDGLAKITSSDVYKKGTIVKLMRSIGGACWQVKTLELTAVIKECDMEPINPLDSNPYTR